VPQPLNLVVELLTEPSRGVIAKQMELVEMCGLALAVHGNNSSLERGDAVGTHLAHRIPSYPLCRGRRFLTEILRRAQPLIGPSGFAGEQTTPGTRTGTLEQPLSLVTRRVECSLGCLGVGWRSERSQQAVRRVDSPPSPPQWQPTTLPTPKPRKKRDSTHPALVGNRVLVRGSKSLVCLDLDSK